MFSQLRKGIKQPEEYILQKHHMDRYGITQLSSVTGLF